MDERLDALLEDVQDALKEVQASHEGLLQGVDQQPTVLEGDSRKKLEKSTSQLQEILSLIGYSFPFHVSC